MADTEPATVIEQWVYLGQYWTGTKLGYRWRDPQGKRLGYQKVKGRIFGGIYRVEVERTTSSTAVYGDALFTGDYAEDRIEVAVAGERALVDAKLRQLEKNTARSSKLDELIAPLLEAAAPLLYDDKRVLAEYVASKIYASRRTK